MGSKHNHLRDWHKPHCECHAPAQGHNFDHDLRCMNGKPRAGLVCGVSWEDLTTAWSLGQHLPCELRPHKVRSPRSLSPAEAMNELQQQRRRERRAEVQRTGG